MNKDAAIANQSAENVEAVLSPDYWVTQLVDAKVKEIAAAEPDPKNPSWWKTAVFQKLTELFEEHPELGTSRAGGNLDLANHQLTYSLPLRAAEELALKYEAPERSAFTAAVLEACIKRSVARDVKSIFETGLPSISGDSSIENVDHLRKLCQEHTAIRAKLLDAIDHLSSENIATLHADVLKSLGAMSGDELKRLYPFLDTGINDQHKKFPNEGQYSKDALGQASHVSGTAGVAGEMFVADLARTLVDDLRTIRPLLELYILIGSKPKYIEKLKAEVKDRPIEELDIMSIGLPRVFESVVGWNLEDVTQEKIADQLKAWAVHT